MFSFPGANGMFYFTPFGLDPPYWIQAGMLRHDPQRVVPSEIPGSKPGCGSPRLIAACHVLHRLLAPRHPPCTLSSLTAMDHAPAMERSRSPPRRYASSSDFGFWVGGQCHFLRNYSLVKEHLPGAACGGVFPGAKIADQSGGGERIRTVDFRLAKPALSR